MGDNAEVLGKTLRSSSTTSPLLANLLMVALSIHC